VTAHFPDKKHAGTMSGQPITSAHAGVLLMLFLFATTDVSPLPAVTTGGNAFGASFDTCWYGSIPSAFHDDPLPVRSHLAFGGTVTPLSSPIGTRCELSLGISGCCATRSLAYGTTVWRSFVAAGPMLDLTFAIDERFSFTTALHLLAGKYAQTSDTFLMLRVSAAAGMQIPMPQSRHHLTLTLPVSVDLRTDYVSVSAGIGFMWRMDRTPKGTT